jgi:hypothetical protein
MTKEIDAPHLYTQAVDACRHSPDSISIAFLQRHLKLNYASAVALMDDLISNDEVFFDLHKGQRIYKLGPRKVQTKSPTKFKKVLVALITACAAWFARGDESHLNVVRWHEPAVLRGTVYKSKYLDCCTWGIEKSKTYYSLKFKSPIRIEGILSEGLMQLDTDEIQLSYSKDVTQRLRLGQTVDISCASILFGSTGHYAKPVFCEKATILPLYNLEVKTVCHRRT